MGKYKALESQLRDLLIQHDPSGLFAMGVPHDEHDASLHAIISRLQHLRDADQVPGALEEVLGDRIRGAGRDPQEVCREMAPRVWQVWAEYSEVAG